MKNRIIILLVLMFAVGLVSAISDNIGTFKPYTDVELYQTCTDCTYCNWTVVKYPNGTAIFTDVNTTRRGSYYSSNLEGQYTKDNGEYIYCYDCGDASTSLTGCLYFDVTPTGAQSTSVWNNPFPIIISFLAILTLGAGLFFRVPAMGFVGSIMFLLVGLYVMIYGFAGITDMYTRGVGVTLLGTGIFFMIVSAYEWTGWSVKE